MTPKQLKKKISKAFTSILRVSQSRASKLLPNNLTSGKAYEAHVLSVVCEKLQYEVGKGVKSPLGCKTLISYNFDHGKTSTN